MDLELLISLVRLLASPGHTLDSSTVDMCRFLSHLVTRVQVVNNESMSIVLPYCICVWGIVLDRSSCRSIVSLVRG